MVNAFEIPKYLLPLFSQADDCGVSTGGSKNTLQDNTKYWTPGIWQGALLIVTVNDQVHVTIVSNNTEQSLSFPSFPSNVPFTQNSYCLKRLPPSLTRPGINLTATQRLMYFGITFQDQVPIPYIYPFIQAPMPAGPGLVSIYNESLGTPLPFGIPVGYALSIIEVRWNFDQDMDSWLYIDGILTTSPMLTGSGLSEYQALLSPYTTLQLDPTASFPHLFDLQVRNRGLGAMMGSCVLTGIIEAIGTPPFPTMKNTQCPFCHTKNSVPVQQNTIICSKCGKLYMVLAIRQGPTKV